MEKSVEKKWYDKTYLVILCCIVFFPIGIYGLWKNNYLSQKYKLFITISILTILYFKFYKKNIEDKKETVSHIGNRSQKFSNNGTVENTKNADIESKNRMLEDSILISKQQRKIDSLEKERKKNEKKNSQKRQVLNCLIGSSFKIFGTYTFYSNGTFSYEQPNPYPGYWKGTWEYIGGNKVRINKTWLGKSSIITVSSYCEVFNLQ